ncbi:ribonuclease BN (tRNA processing enzyme) [Desulfohalotomaculum tongense]|uniref:MBL fold metallo-hydrolase n=1 Tax=Desulforadius tongensis TaxID=1216062 RepID=UPI0019593CDD|nr:MBL fold metallo-hydrolase [Desulforadius tongensis]MBM7855446.1 ribonuclease BN (tRNA processing enzyme) [Desulforadius tongensis]
MQLTVLGRYAPYPAPGGACSGYLIQNGETSIMLEAGNGSFSRLCKHIDFRYLAAVVITHLHPDHYMDIFCLRHAIAGAIREKKRPGPLALFMPGSPAEEYQRLAQYTDTFIINKIEDMPTVNLTAGVQVHRCRVGMLQLEFALNRHPVPAYAVGIDCGRGRMVFSGDTSRTKELEELARGADLFLCEASGLDKDVEFVRGSHLTARQAGQLAKDAGVRKLLITHLYPEYNINELSIQAGEGYGKTVAVAKEDAKYDIKNA